MHCCHREQKVGFTFSFSLFLQCSASNKVRVINLSLSTADSSSVCPNVVCLSVVVMKLKNACQLPVNFLLTNCYQLANIFLKIC